VNDVAGRARLHATLGGAATDRAVRLLHTAAIAAGLVLYAGSPWIAMLRRLPREASFFDYAHVAAGTFALVVAFAFLLTGLLAGRWREYFPWASGQLAAVGRDVAGLLRGRMPSGEGAGLNSALKGFVLLAMLGTAATGAAWYLQQGADAALACRAAHASLAHALAALVVLHAATALAHVIELARR
jgi:cytochrome b561